jgi:acyl-CoA thioester hydrolase
VAKASLPKKNGLRFSQTVAKRGMPIAMSKFEIPPFYSFHLLIFESNKPTKIMFSHQSQIRVRYAETDQMAYVYYGNYALYYEVARVEAFRFLGFPYKDLEASGMMMPVLELHTRYIRAAKYDDLLTIQTVIQQMPSVKIVFQYQIFNEQAVLLNTGETTLVFVDIKTQTPRRCPPEILSLFKPYF